MNEVKWPAPPGRPFHLFLEAPPHRAHQDLPAESIAGERLVHPSPEVGSRRSFTRKRTRRGPGGSN